MNKYFFATLIFSGMAFAQNKATCYKAENPQNISVKIYNENAMDGITRLAMDEKGKAAGVRFRTDDIFKDDQGNFSSVDVLVRTKSLKAKTSASDFNRNGQYGIECDGGQIAFKKSGQKLIANTEYLTAYALMANSGECAGDATIEMKDVVFKKVTCPYKK